MSEEAEIHTPFLLCTYIFERATTIVFMLSSSRDIVFVP